jgi:hypothetical protein
LPDLGIHQQEVRSIALKVAHKVCLNETDLKDEIQTKEGGMPVCEPSGTVGQNVLKMEVLGGNFEIISGPHQTPISVPRGQPSLVCPSGWARDGRLQGVIDKVTVK